MTTIKRNALRHRDSLLQKKSVQPGNIGIGDYVMVRTHAMHEFKKQPKWYRPMQMKETKFGSVLVENLLNNKQQTAHAQRILLLFKARGSSAICKELRLQADHNNNAYHLLDKITHTCRKDFLHTAKKLSTTRDALNQYPKSIRVKQHS